MFSAIFDRILFIFAGNEDMYKSLNELEIRPDAITGFHGNHRVIMGKCVHSSAFIFDQIFFILAGIENIYNISVEFEIRSDRTKDCGVSRH